MPNFDQALSPKSGPEDSAEQQSKVWPDKGGGGNPPSTLTVILNRSRDLAYS